MVVVVVLTTIPKSSKNAELNEPYNDLVLVAMAEGSGISITPLLSPSPATPLPLPSPPLSLLNELIPLVVSPSPTECDLAEAVLPPPPCSILLDNFPRKHPPGAEAPLLALWTHMTTPFGTHLTNCQSPSMPETSSMGGKC